MKDKLISKLQKDLDKKTSEAIAEKQRAQDWENDYDYICNIILENDYKDCKCGLHSFNEVVKAKERARKRRYRMGERRVLVVDKLRTKNKDLTENFSQLQKDYNHL